MSRTDQPPKAIPPDVDNLILFDGECALCHTIVRRLLKIDRKGLLYYAPARGETAGEVAERHDIDIDPHKSVLLVRNFRGPDEQVYWYSDSILHTFRALGGAWSMLSWLRIIPRFIRDTVYRHIARHRYRWFGTVPPDELPDTDYKRRFLP